ncbi:MAG: hypothetical protein LBD01_01485 [Puniceicoccales bacterium]|jgi:hypothetical protein|nr:hypothetical protein [Puniceicoccales bacterium]
MTSFAATSSITLPTLRWRQQSLYLWSAAFVAGNLALPQLCHLANNGGRMFLPIYFFTLVAASAFGWRAGVLTALASPLLNHALFGMPPSATLVPIVAKSLLIAALAPVLLRRFKLLPLALLAIVLGYQVLGGLFEWAWTGSRDAALHDFTIGWPGMALQVLGAWAVLFLVNQTRKNQ